MGYLTLLSFERLWDESVVLQVEQSTDCIYRVTVSGYTSPFSDVGNGCLMKRSLKQVGWVHSLHMTLLPTVPRRHEPFNQMSRSQKVTGDKCIWNRKLIL